MATVLVSLAGGLLVFLVGAKVETEATNTTLPSVEDIPVEWWAKLAGKRIFFGHHSVGSNIINGIRDVMSEREHIRLNVVRTNNPADFDRPVFGHYPVGRNLEPESKIEGFKDIMDAGLGEKVDIAFFKFCFVDLRADAAPQRILADYTTAMQELQRRYPRVRFVHVTVPLTSPPATVKGRLKEVVKVLLGRPRTGDLEANTRRQQYNRSLLDGYAGAEEVFDLALVESTNPAGLRTFSRKGSQKIPVLAPEHTEDGGHLNPRGSRKAAEQLLITLAGIANRL